MAQYQFNQTVRLVPRGQKPKVFAAKSVQDITDPEILKHPHFKKFLAAKMIVPHVPKKVEQLKAVPEARKPLKPGQLPGVGGQHKLDNDAKVKAKAEAAATKVSPETEVGADDEAEAEESDDEAPAKPAKKGSKK